MKTISDNTLIWKNEKFIKGIFKNHTISYFWLKKRNPYIKFCLKIILWSRHLYHEVYKLLKNFTETREKWARVFFICMFVTSYNFETTTHTCVSMALWRHWRVWEGEESCNLVCSIFKLFPWTLPHVFWGWKFRIRNFCPMDKMSSNLQWRLLKFNCFLLCFQAAAFCYFLFSKYYFVLRASSSDDLTGRGVTSRLISLFSLFIS